jgi:hypothetical protein
MRATTTEIVGLLGTIVVLAGLTVVVVNGGKVATIIQAAGSAFAKSIKVATQQ